VSTEDRIVGKVARITSDRELIINRGAEHGVDEGMRFIVKGEPVDVPDPDTGESLGQVTSVKVIVQIREVDSKFAIARTFRSRRVNLGGSSSGPGSIAGMFQPPKWETRVETLRRNPKADAPLSEVDSIVQVGDIVESLLDGEDYENTSTALWR
jgi:hypothetical protein